MLRGLALCIIAAPLAFLLIAIAPPRALAGVLIWMAALSVVIAAVASTRRRGWVWIALLTGGLITGDVLFHGGLISGSVLGYSPAIGARYYGLGNEYGGVLLAAIPLGLLGLIAIFYSSLNDPEANARVVLQLLQQQFDPRQIGGEALRQEVETALAYQQRIETQIRRQRAGVLRGRLEDTANQIGDWIANIYRLAVTLDAYRRDDLLAQERETVPEEIENLSGRRDRAGAKPGP